MVNCRTACATPEPQHRLSSDHEVCYLPCAYESTLPQMAITIGHRTQLIAWKPRSRDMLGTWVGRYVDSPTLLRLGEARKKGRMQEHS